MLEHFLEEQSQEPEDFTAVEVERVTGLIKEWLCSDSNSPFSSLARWPALGKGFRKQEGGLPRILWEKDNETLVYLGNRLSILDFRSTARAVVEECTALTVFRTGPLLDFLAFNESNPPPVSSPAQLVYEWL